MFAPRHFPRAERPAPRPLSALSRPELSARIHVSRQVLDVLWASAEYDRAEPSHGIGALKVELVRLEQSLRDMDCQEKAAWPHGVHESPEAQTRLRNAGADLSEVVREIAVDGARAMARAADRVTLAQIRAAQDEAEFADAVYSAAYGDCLPPGTAARGPE